MNEPLPFPNNTLTLLLPELAVTMSGLPSPLTSATATEVGFVPTAKGEPGAIAERAGAVPQQHTDVVIVIVGDDEVGETVADVRDRHRTRIRADGEGRAGGTLNVPLPFPSNTLTFSP